MSGDRTLEGSSRREIGEAFEKWIDERSTAAGLRGALAHITHNDPPTKVVAGQLIWEEPGIADYSGVLHGGGALAMEAKSVKPGARLAKSRVAPKQEAHLDAVTAAGGNSLALLIVEFRDLAAPLHRHYAIPWHEVPWKRLRTAETLNENDIAKHYRINLGEDFLSRYHAGSSMRYIVGERRKRVYPTE